ncbi:MAG: prepilin-type N-terminal cleavage/methylation domain-containing protein [Verrucomicrobia bacterium]|nr:prepilin-type N-terminal cleavage/methylation domain-containing protein [Verrucomicrobiota bacterium]
MTTSTPSPIRKPASARRARGAFTLVEVMVGATLSSFVLAAVLSTFLFMGRSGANFSNYSDMESQARKALEIFAEDVRQASAISWTSSTYVTLTVNSASIVFNYDSSTSCFYRRTSSSTQTLITGITAGTFAFKAYNVAGTELPLATAANLTAAGSSTKQLQISLEAARTTRTVATATNLVLSARYILRNKIVTA